jgi:hypothetical protein
MSNESTTPENVDTATADAAIPNWFPSIVQCSAATGVSVATLKRAKKAKAPGFESRDRVNWQRLQPWLEQNATSLLITDTDDTRSADKKRKERAEADILEMKRDEMAGRYVDMDKAKAFHKSLCGALSALLKSKWITEHPPKARRVG